MRTAFCASALVCVWMLGTRPAHPAAEQYARDLRSSVPSVREHAAVSLGRTGDRSAVPALIEALKDPEKDVRRAAAKALGFIKDLRAVPSLLETLRDSDKNVRLYAAYALGEIKDGVAKFGIHREAEGPGYIAAGGEQIGGRWVHLAGVIKSDRIELYVNGKLAAKAKTPGYIPGNCGQGMEIGYDTGNSPAEITDHFQGIIDEVKVYHAALSEADIAREARPEPSKPQKH